MEQELRSKDQQWIQSCLSKPIEMKRILLACKYTSLIKYMEERALVKNLTGFCLQLLLDHGVEINAHLRVPKNSSQAISILVSKIFENLFHVRIFFFAILIFILSLLIFIKNLVFELRQGAHPNPATREVSGHKRVEAGDIHRSDRDTVQLVARAQIVARQPASADRTREAQPARHPHPLLQQEPVRTGELWACRATCPLTGHIFLHELEDRRCRSLHRPVQLDEWDDDKCQLHFDSAADRLSIDGRHSRLAEQEPVRGRVLRAAVARVRRHAGEQHANFNSDHRSARTGSGQPKL